MVNVYAHRGASAEQPENTIAAFRRALEIGMYGIELDVYLSKDGVAVVIHDSSVNRTTNGSGELSDLDFAEIRALDAGRGESVPTLEDVIALVAGKTHLNIEVKADAAADEVLRLASQASGLSWGISSFDWDVLRYARRRDSGIDLWPLGIGATEDALKVVQEIGANQLNLFDPAIDEDIVAFLAERGIGTWVWTVNDPARAALLAEWGATGICTDNPRVIQDALATASRSGR
ncbi:MAG TPA: glycerophosphodiester phosphodiesterase family protein [Thermomicrobiales bacterium]|nr:glycerophosphodiester phosphodiesterase family protein [Thermomicrobiales bacterium]